VVKVPKANNLVMYQENKLDVGRYTNTNENRNSKTDGPVLLLRTTPSGGRHTNKRWDLAHHWIIRQSVIGRLHPTLVP
jgi:hypothetical protein